MDLHADYVVVGAGSAGSVIARRLVDNTDATVLVLEAGGRDRNPAIHDPRRMHELWHSPEDWDYFTIPQRHAAGRRLHLPRGRVLGGSHALNATIWVRGNPADYDEWAALGNKGWAWRDVEPLFRRIERYDRDLSGGKGMDGLLDVLTAFEPDPVQRDILLAAGEAGIPGNRDHNSGVQDGAGPVHFTIRAGQRLTTADAYLKPVLDDRRITLCTGARVHRVVVRGGRACGVSGSVGGRQVTVTASTAVILAAGAIDSAALLLRSGIGPAVELRAVGVDVVADVPGVGRNLTDHWLVPVIFAAEREITHACGLPPAQTQLFWRTDPGLDRPDLQPLHFSVPLYESWMSGPANGFTLLAGLVRPESRGWLRITGPEDRAPLIDPDVLGEPVDELRLVEAVRLGREVGSAPALREWGAVEHYPGPHVHDTHGLRDYVRRSVVTYHHVSGTCRMGIGADAVVDPELRVHGIDGLRVADASVLPRITTGNTNAPAIMVAERAAELLSRDESTRL